MSSKNHIPNTVAASLDSPRQERSSRRGLINDLKLLFAALGAGGSAVPLGDNGRTARLLSEYAAALRGH